MSNQKSINKETVICSILVIFPILNYNSVLIAYGANDSFSACKIASNHSLYYANTGANVVILEPVKIKHMPSHS